MTDEWHSANRPSHVDFCEAILVFSEFRQTPYLPRAPVCLASLHQVTWQSVLPNRPKWKSSQVADSPWLIKNIFLFFHIICRECDSSEVTGEIDVPRGLLVYRGVREGMFIFSDLIKCQASLVCVCKCRERLLNRIEKSSTVLREQLPRESQEKRVFVGFAWCTETDAMRPRSVSEFRWMHFSVCSHSRSSR